MIDLDAISTMINANTDWVEFYKGLPVETIEVDYDDIDEETGEALQQAMDADTDYSDYILF